MVSRAGYTSSGNGVVFDDRLSYPAYVSQSPGGSMPSHARRYSPMMYPSGGSWGGCEGSRMVTIEGTVYVTFNMSENWVLRVAYISISEEDFLCEALLQMWMGCTSFRTARAIRIGSSSPRRLMENSQLHP